MDAALLPGGDLIRDGMDDLRRKAETIPALLVSIGAPRLARLGLPLPPPFEHPEHRLYGLLVAADPRRMRSCDRRLFVADIGRLSFYHFDPYAQALAKVERGHAQDLADVREMLERGMITAERALEYVERLAPDLYRYPAISEPAFRRAVAEAFGSK